LWICKYQYRHETSIAIQFLQTIHKKHQWSIITVQCEGNKKNERTGKGMQHFPKKTKQKKRCFPKYWEYIALLGTRDVIPDGKEEKVGLGCTKEKKAMMQHIGRKN
jgi:hypothetical protein